MLQLCQGHSNSHNKLSKNKADAQDESKFSYGLRASAVRRLASGRAISALRASLRSARLRNASADAQCGHTPSDETKSAGITPDGVVGLPAKNHDRHFACGGRTVLCAITSIFVKSEGNICRSFWRTQLFIQFDRGALQNARKMNIPRQYRMSCQRNLKKNQIIEIRYRSKNRSIADFVLLKFKFLPRGLPLIRRLRRHFLQGKAETENIQKSKKERTENRSVPMRVKNYFFSQLIILRSSAPTFSNGC